MSFRYAYALSGGIATGKSSVGKIFRQYGVDIIDADSVAHEILEEQKEEIVRLFGERYLKDGKVNRKRLGGLVFGSSDAKKRLEDLLHPLIYKEIERRSNMLDALKKPYFIDIPLFYETNRYPIETSVLVYAPKNIQLKRLIKRNSFSKKEATERIESQMDIEIKKKLATHVIDNSGSLHALQRECDRIYGLLF